jgi:glucosamine-6-phosphate deaminase
MTRPDRSASIKSMQTFVHQDRPTLGRAAAADAAEAIHAACRSRGSAHVVVATGASQFEMLAELRAIPGLPWDAITLYHLDEYVGLPGEHPASFRRYLHERFVDLLPVRPAAFHEVDGSGDPEAECRRLGGLVPDGDFDLALIGIGENAHLAFNDPPADFDTRAAYLVVALDDACRRQQVGEGWFPTLADVPTRAISMSVQRILASRRLVCSVPGPQKAAAVQATLEGPVTPAVPASVLHRHPDCRLHLDRDSASRLSRLRQPHGTATHGTA